MVGNYFAAVGICCNVNVLRYFFVLVNKLVLKILEFLKLVKSLLYRRQVVLVKFIVIAWTASEFIKY